MPGFSALSYRTKLTYYEPAITLYSGASIAGTYVFSANGLFDPDITSTGHQPMGFDQMMLSFEHYVVLGARMTANFRNATTTLPADVSISRNAGTTALTDYVRLVENGNMVRTKLNAINSFDAISTLSLPINIAKFGGVDDILDNPSYEGSLSANPAEQSYFHLSVWNPSTTDAVALNIEAFIEYDVIFREPRKNSLSLQQQMSKLILAESRSRECKR